MRKIELYIDESYGDLLTITAIGNGFAKTNVSTAAFDVSRGTVITIDENGRAMQTKKRE